MFIISSSSSSSSSNMIMFSSSSSSSSSMIIIIIVTMRSGWRARTGSRSARIGRRPSAGEANVPLSSTSSLLEHVSYGETFGPALVEKSKSHRDVLFPFLEVWPPSTELIWREANVPWKRRAQMGRFSWPDSNHHVHEHLHPERANIITLWILPGVPTRLCVCSSVHVWFQQSPGRCRRRRELPRSWIFWWRLRLGEGSWRRGSRGSSLHSLIGLGWAWKSRPSRSKESDLIWSGRSTSPDAWAKLEMAA